MDPFRSRAAGPALSQRLHDLHRRAEPDFGSREITRSFWARFQSGEFHTSDRLDNAVQDSPPLSSIIPPAAHDFDTSLEREKLYVYDTWRPFRTLSLTGGLSYDRLGVSHRLPQPSDRQRRRFPRSAFAEGGRDLESDREFVCARSLYPIVRRRELRSKCRTRAEPGRRVQSGLSQHHFRVCGGVGSVAAPTYDTTGILIEDRFPTGTYIGLQATLLQSDVDRTVGTFDAFLAPPFPPSLHHRSADHRVVHSAEVALRGAGSPLHGESIGGR